MISAACREKVISLDEKSTDETEKERLFEAQLPFPTNLFLRVLERKK